MIRTCLFLLLTAACGGGITTRDPPAPPGAGLRLLLQPDPEDQSAAQALGWNGAIPAAEVTLTPQDSSSPPRTLVSTATGLADFGSMVAGRYSVEVRRWLTPAEQALLPRGEDVNGWVAKHLVTATAQGGDQPLSVQASRRHGLVISEWAFNSADFVEVNATYRNGGFLELYNNADTTVYLDGLTVVHGLTREYDYPNYGCLVFAPLTNDPEGIWTTSVQQFPGTGHEHPVAPGRTVVIAVDAIDHSKIIPSGLDLSHADFEFWGGPGDVDNPAVPNMVDTLSIRGDPLGIGMHFELGAVAALAWPYPKATSSRWTSRDGTEYARVAGELVIDVVSLWPNYVAAWPRCPQLVSPRFDRASSDARGFDWDVEYQYSISRRALPPATAGRVVLQHSRNSDADFVRTRRSPGVVP